MPKGLHRLNAEEEKIFALALEGKVRPFTDYYLRGPNTGTWWLPGARTPVWRRGYARIHKYWLGHDRPDRFVYDFKEYMAVRVHERSDRFPNAPAFHQNHGFLFLPWQEMLHNDRTPIRTIIGGFGSGKTLSQAVSLLIHAAVLPGFRAFGLAPEATQANEILKLAYQVMSGTVFEERFLLGYTRGPNALMKIGNSKVGGENTIECKPILKKEESLRTISGDMAVVDQAERFDDVEEVIREVGTRFRGRVLETGRGRIGTLTLVANASYNDSLWHVFEKGKEGEKGFMSIQPSTYDNPYLTDEDILRYEMQVGDDDESKRIYLLGGRPLGDGKEFSKDVLMRMGSPELDREMASGLDAKLSGYSYQQMKGVGVHEWLLPYKEGHKYLVVSDPGTDNPPKRNAYGVMVWDVTHFPIEPATLAGYVWGFGRGDIQNWANKHAELTWRFRAVAANAFDATGFQSGYDTWMSILNNLLSEKINLGGNAKSDCLNSAKMLCSAGKIKIPVMPETGNPIFNQLQRYELPEPQKLRQDLVMVLIMSCWWLKRLYFFSLEEPETLPFDEGRWKEDRYERPIQERYTAYSR